MNYKEEIQELKKMINMVRSNVQRLIPNSRLVQNLDDLYQDIIDDFYSIVIVGEFKQGKSTFINALLGEKLLPVDVTPTTATINALMYGDKKGLQIIKTDGSTEDKPLTNEVLKQYTANSDFDPDQIKYLKLFLPHPLLENRVVLIDTPGINDLNQHRADITYNYIPKADVVLFMIDLTAPVRGSEKTFLKDTLLKQGKDRIVFVANFADLVDEGELEDALDVAQRRLANIMGEKELTIYPLSAISALKGKLEGDKQLVENSGLPKIEEQIHSMINLGSRGKEKLHVFQMRFRFIAENLYHEIETLQNLSQQSTEELKEQLENIKKWYEQQEQIREQMIAYIKEREQEIRYIVRKSVHYFEGLLEEETANVINLFHGSNIKILTESQLPIFFRSKFTQWIDRYSDPIHLLFYKLEYQISKGLTEAFKQTVNIKSNQPINFQFDPTAPVINNYNSNTAVKTGLVVGGASALIMAVGAPFLVPIVGLVGLPFLNQKLSESHLEKIKPELIVMMRQHIHNVIDEFQNALDHYIHQFIGEIEAQSLDEFTRLIGSLKSQITMEFEKRNQEVVRNDKFQNELDQLRGLVEEYLQTI